MEINLRALLDEVFTRDASDLHIGVGMPPMIRVDGELAIIDGVAPMTFAQVERILLEVISPEQYRKFTAVGELDFSFFHVNAGVEARFRGNCYSEMRGISAAFRLIPTRIRTVEELLLPRTLLDVARSRRGFFLVTGPTGHGKSTTLAAIVHEINNTRHDHIITIENPIEYVHEPSRCMIHQREVGANTGSFAEAIKGALRQDPDVILIGELRDLETVAAAITAAETGHFVLATLHTQDASQSVDRLIDVFPHNQQEQIRVQLASVLVGICSQQLLPKKGGGRICATEFLMANTAVRNNIREGKTNQIRALLQTGAASGMHTMEQCLADLVRSGIVARETAMLYAYNSKELARALADDQVAELKDDDVNPEAQCRGNEPKNAGGVEVE